MTTDTRRAYLNAMFARESVFEAAIMTALESAGFSLRYHTHRSDHSEAGFKDITAIHPGRGVLWTAEVKGPKTRITPAQWEWERGWDSVRRVVNGGIVRPVDYDRACDQISDLGRGLR